MPSRRRPPSPTRGRTPGSAREVRHRVDRRGGGRLLHGRRLLGRLGDGEGAGDVVDEELDAGGGDPALSTSSSRHKASTVHSPKSVVSAGTVSVASQSPPNSSKLGSTVSLSSTSSEVSSRSTTTSTSPLVTHPVPVTLISVPGGPEVGSITIESWAGLPSRRRDDPEHEDGQHNRRRDEQTTHGEEPTHVEPRTSGPPRRPATQRPTTGAIRRRPQRRRSQRGRVPSPRWRRCAW